MSPTLGCDSSWVHIRHDVLTGSQPLEHQLHDQASDSRITRLEGSPVQADVALKLERLIETRPITSAIVLEWTQKDPVLDI